MSFYFDTVIPKNNMAAKPLQSSDHPTATMLGSGSPQSPIGCVGHHHDCTITSEIPPHHVAIFCLCPGEDDDCPRCMLEHPRDDRLEGKRRRVSTAVVQRFCKPKVGGSIPSPGTIAQGEARHGHAVTAAPQDTGQAHSQAIILRANTSRVGVARRRRMRIADQHPA